MNVILADHIPMHGCIFAMEMQAGGYPLLPLRNRVDEAHHRMERFGNIAGISNASVNSLRHTFSAQLAAKRRNKGKIKKVTGHRDVRTTGKYYSIAGFTE